MSLNSSFVEKIFQRGKIDCVDSNTYSADQIDEQFVTDDL